MKARSKFLFLQAALVLLAAGQGWLAGPTRPAQAHASLTGSDPESGAALEQAPQTVTLEFSEGLDGALSRARLVDASNQVVAEGPGYIDPDNPLALRLDLPALPEGAYSVLWQARSTVDGHITQGSVPFSIGQDLSQVSLLPPPATAYVTAARPPLIESLLRWAGYLALALMGGSLIFALAIWRPAYRAQETVEEGTDRQAARRLRLLAGGGALGALFVSILFVLYQAWEASQGPLGGSFLTALLGLLDLHNGPLLWARFLVLGLVALLARTLTGPGAGPARPWWEAAVLALGALLTYSLQAHGAARGIAWAVILDWLHMAGMAAWIGGLLPLLLSLRSRSLPARDLVPRFSALALVSVGALALTGLGGALLHVGSLEALLSTFYGRSLALKLGLFALLFLLGALNLLVLSPRLRAQESRAAPGLETSVRVELALGALLLLFSGLLTGAFPAREAMEAERRLGYIGSYAGDSATLKLWVAPGRAGHNEVAVDVDGLPAGRAEAQVLLQFTMLDHNMGTIQVEAAPGEASRYSARGSYLSMAGDWQIEVILRQAGREDIRHAFQLPVREGEVVDAPQNPIPAGPDSLQTGEALYLQNCLPCHGEQGRGDGPAGLALNPRPADLTEHTVPGLHPDWQLFEWITNGTPGSAMPAFRDLLSEEQRWHLVNYIRTFGATQKGP